MIGFLARLLVCCGHERETWPMRLSGEAVAHRTCLDCGRRRPCYLFETHQHSFHEASDRALVCVPAGLLGPARRA